jgi:hypothetical protein
MSDINNQSVPLHLQHKLARQPMLQVEEETKVEGAN